MTSTPISNAARLLRECAEEIKSTCTAAGAWCSEAADDKAAYEERIAAANLLESMPSQCLLQIQEPPTKTEALAHYSQQAILAMGEAAHAAVAVPDVMVKEVMGLVELHRQEIIKAMDEEGYLVDVQTAQDAIEAKLSSLLGAVSAPASSEANTLRDLLNRRPAVNSGLVEEYTYWNSECYRVMGANAATPANDAAPQAQADAQDADDAALVEWLSGQYLSADFHWGDPKTPVLVIEIPPTASVCGDFRTDVRSSIAAQAAQRTQGGEHV